MIPIQIPIAAAVPMTAPAISEIETIAAQTEGTNVQFPVVSLHAVTPQAKESVEVKLTFKEELQLISSKPQPINGRQSALEQRLAEDWQTTGG